MFHKGQKSEKITGRRGAYSLCLSVGTERVEGEKLSPEEIIGSANIKKLLLAGYKIIPSDRGRCPCPRCDYFASNMVSNRELYIKSFLGRFDRLYEVGKTRPLNLS